MVRALSEMAVLLIKSGTLSRQLSECATAADTFRRHLETHDFQPPFKPT